MQCPIRANAEAESGVINAVSGTGPGKTDSAEYWHGGERPGSEGQIGPGGSQIIGVRADHFVRVLRIHVHALEYAFTES
jgi:hypothetical protein